MVVLCLGLPGVASVKPTTHTAFNQALTDLADGTKAELHNIGTSTQGRQILALRFPNQPQREGAEKPHTQTPCVALLVGQQHGDEPAGGEALLQLAEGIARQHIKLPASLDLWLIPQMNPDGAEINQRRNAADADLNRDHLVLEQPETLALHRLVQTIKPHLFIDCHEFTRDSASYTDHGYLEWPDIMLDTANLPSMPDALYEAGVNICDQVAQPMQDAGFNYCRYHLGSFPGCADHGPVGELRHSTMDPDDARNAVSAHGAVSFIIETGVFRSADNPHHDLDRRTAAQLTLLRLLIADASRIQSIRTIAENSRTAAPPQAFPTNSFWAQTTASMTQVPVINAANHQTVWIPTPNFATTRVIKQAVPMPAGYLIRPAATEVLAALLDRHALPTNTVPDRKFTTVQDVHLIAIQDTFDSVYQRYAGRQITQSQTPHQEMIEPGSFTIDLGRLSPIDARRAALILEPLQLYGLYQWPTFRPLTDANRRLPVARLLTPATTTTTTATGKGTTN